MRRSRFRASASLTASIHTSVILTGTSSPTTFRFMPVGFHVPVVLNTPIANWFARGTGGKRDCSRFMRPHPWSYPGYAYRLESIRTAPLISMAFTSWDGGLKYGEAGLLPAAAAEAREEVRVVGLELLGPEVLPGRDREAVLEERLAAHGVRIGPVVAGREHDEALRRGVRPPVRAARRRPVRARSAPPAIAMEDEPRPCPGIDRRVVRRDVDAVDPGRSADRRAHAGREGDGDVAVQVLAVPVREVHSEARAAEDVVSVLLAIDGDLRFGCDARLGLVPLLVRDVHRRVTGVLDQIPLPGVSIPRDDPRHVRPMGGSAAAVPRRPRVPHQTRHAVVQARRGVPEEVGRAVVRVALVESRVQDSRTLEEVVRGVQDRVGTGRAAREG